MKKDCLKARDLITLLIDKRIDPKGSEWLDNHMLSCGRCSRNFKEIKNITGILKNIKHEIIPGDFYYKLNKSLDEVDEKRKKFVYSLDFQFVFRSGLVFTILLLGFIVTINVVKNGNKFNVLEQTPIAMEKEQKIEMSITKKSDNIMSLKEKLIIHDRVEKEDIAVADKTTVDLIAPITIEIGYKKPTMPFSLISTGEQNTQQGNAFNRFYMKPVPAKSYYDLNQWQVKDKFDIRVLNFVIDDKYTWEKFRLKYGINDSLELDFQKENIVLVVCENDLFGNYSIEIIKAKKEIDKIVIFYKLNKLDAKDVLDKQDNIKKYDIKIFDKTQLPFIFKRIE